MIISLVSTHFFYPSVNKKSFPILSFSLLKLEITIPTNKFKMKKEATIMKKTKKMPIGKLWFLTGR